MMPSDAQRKPRAACPACENKVIVRKDGTLHTHMRAAPNSRSARLICEGSRRPPGEIVGETYRRPIPLRVRAMVLQRDGNACLHCGTTESLTMDHIYPWSLGGSDDATNLQALCGPCNNRKGTAV